MIDEIKQALDKATLGKWESKVNRHPESNGNPWGWMDSKGGQLFTWSGSRNANYQNDNHLIANAPEWLRYLIGEVERLRKEIIDQRNMFHEKAYKLVAVSENAYILNLQNENEALRKALKESKEQVATLQTLEYESPSLRHNTCNMIMWKIDQALGEVNQ